MKMRMSQKVHYDAGPNMTPLVDIVMVILIFMMLTGTFAIGEHYLQSPIPITQRGSNQSANPNVPLNEPIDIRVDTTSRPGVDGQAQDEWVAQVGATQIKNSRESLTARLLQLREQMNRAGTATDRILIVINPGRQTKYKHLIEVYEAALRAHFTKVSFSGAH
jgi:biopolymer transport protein ExbD